MNPSIRNDFRDTGYAYTVSFLPQRAVIIRILLRSSSFPTSRHILRRKIENDIEYIVHNGKQHIKIGYQKWEGGISILVKRGKKED